ncbi:MAG: adenylate/guanylate cyclase domain-containing protein, partial [Bacteroidetes bacterium]|nr:adenylate/guanylate cyclase domain-containing protein [Bacteroidota bacterium]
SLSMFNSGIEAVQCAIEIQNQLFKEPKIPVRVGIHVGDIVKEDDGIYGDGVNIASRIESISVPGAVLISDRLQGELGNQPDIKTKSLGKFQLKNVKRHIEIFAVAAGKIKVPSPGELNSEKVKSVKSIAVLPFVNMSADPENEYFSDGITEEILNALVKVEGLQVTSRTSSFAFKNKILDAREIAKQLNVNTILEGSVRKAGNKVRVTAQLINSADGFHIWSDVYDRKLEGYHEDKIARELNVYHDIEYEDAIEKIRSIEVHDNDRTAKTLFGKKFADCNEAEVSEMKIRGGEVKGKKHDRR